MRSLFAATICSTLFLSSCVETNGDRQVILTNVADVTVRSDMIETFPMTAETFQIQIIEGQFAQLDPATIQATLTVTIERQDIPPGVTHPPELPLGLSLDSGAALQLGSNDIEVVIDNAEFADIEISLLIDVVGRRMDNSELEVTSFTTSFSVLNTTPPEFNTESPPEIVIEAILGRDVPDFGQFGIDDPVGAPVIAMTAAEDPRVPPLLATEVFQSGTFVTDLSQQQIDDAFLGMDPTFPIGSGDFGTTTESQMALPLMPGRYLFAWFCCEEDVPVIPVGCFPSALFCLSDYQICFDSDGDEANNFQPSIPNDQEQTIDTDLSFSLQGSDFFGILSAEVVRRATPGPMMGFVDEPTAARVIAFGPAVIFVIPVDEIAATQTVNGRLATLIHDGGLGVGPGGSFDTVPQIDQPLREISLESDL